MNIRQMDCRTRNSTRDKEGYFRNMGQCIMKIWQLYIYTHVRTKSWNTVSQNWQMKGEIERSIITLEISVLHLQKTDRIIRQKISKDIEDFNTISQLHLINIYKTFYLITAHSFQKHMEYSPAKTTYRP